MAQFKITLRRVITVEIKHEAEDLRAARQWARGWDLIDLQHEGETVSDEPRIAKVEELYHAT